MNTVSMPMKATSKSVSNAQLYPWVVVFFSSLFLFYKYILQVSPSVMTSQLMSAYHLNGVGLGNLAATYFYAYLVMQLFSGPLLDRFSPRFLSAFALVVCSVGALDFAMSQSLTGAVLARGLIGVGAAFATVSYMKFASVWFAPERFAFVGGLLATAAMLGALFGEAPLALLVSKVGWQMSLYYCAWLGLAIALLFFVFMRDKNPQQQSLLNSQNPVTVKSILSVLKNKKNWLLTFYSGLAFSPVATFGGLWGNPFLQQAYHLSGAKAAGFTSFLFVGLAVGGPLLGFVSDRLGKRMLVMGVGTALSLLAVLAVLYLTAQPLWMLALMLFLFGFGTGSFMVGFAVGKELNSVLLAGTVIALINTGDAIFGAFSEPFVGKLLDVFWDGKVEHGAHVFAVHSYQLAFVILPAYLALALVCLWGLRKVSC